MKMMSASFSILSAKEFVFLIERKDNRQLAINKIMADKVISSITDLALLSNNFNEVNTIKQMPNKLEEAFKI